MANKKISQLSATTEANDNVWLVINNSGETETFKIKRSDLVAGVDTAGLVSGTGSNSMKSNDDLITNPATAQQSYSIILGDNASDTAAGGGGIAIGRNATAGGNTTGIAIGTNTSATGRGYHIGNGGNANGDGAVGFGLNNTATKESAIAIGGDINTTGNWGIGIGRLTNTNAAKGVSIGFRNDITNANPNGGDGEGNAILAGYSNDISSTGKINTIIGGSDNVLSGTTSGTTLIGLINYTSPTEDNTTYVDKLYSVGSKIDGTDNNLLIGGESDNSIITGATNAFILGGKLNQINNNTYNFGEGGEFIIGGRGNEIESSSRGYYNGIISARDSKIGFGTSSTIIGGQLNQNDGGASTIISSQQATINSTNNSNCSIIGSYDSDINSNSATAGIYSSFQSNINNGSQRSVILGGEGHNITGQKAVIIGGEDNTNNSVRGGIYTSLQSTVNTDTAGVIVGGQANTIGPGGYYQGIFAGQTNTAKGVSSVILGGASNLTETGSDFSAIVGGQSNEVNNDWNVVVGGQNNNIVGGTHSAISSSIGSTANGDTTIDISASYQSDVTGASYRSIIAGTYQSSINAGTGCAVIGTYADITGSGNGYDIIAGGISHTLTSSSYSTILGGQNNTITSSNESALISTNGSLISGGSLNSVVLGGRNTTIGDLDEVIMLGTNNESALYSATTHVENIHTFKTETFSTYSGGTVGGSIDIDVSQATMYKFSISANTTPNITNWKEGQRLVFVVENLGTYTVPTMTITGGGSVLVKGGSINLTNNGITKYTGVIIDGDLYLNEELDFQAL